MLKIKHIFSVIILAVIIYACDNQNLTNNPFLDVNHEALAITDNDSIVKFLQNHYYDFAVDSIKPITSGQQSMYNDSRLETVDLTENDINYKLYVYVAEQGDYGSDTDKGFPTFVDSVFVNYEGRTYSGSSLSDSPFDQNTTGIWFNLTSVVRGWSFGFPFFKGGELKKEANGDPFNGPITYLNGGKGVLFIPSGLGYPSSNSSNWSNTLVDTNLMFYINLLTIVPDTDHDNDGVKSLFEDVDGDKSVANDDTDSDGVPNFFDNDDDGDGVLTKDEDANGDGDPSNDFSDPNNPTLPDYLNPDIK